MEDFKNKSIKELDESLAAAQSLTDDEIAQLTPDQMEYIQRMKAHRDSIAPSELESSIRGAAQGFFSQGADELEAGLHTATNILADIAVPGENISSISEDYNKELETARMKNKNAQEANPKSYLAGNFGGSIAQTAGITALNPAAGAAMLTPTGQAVSGGIQGFLGSNEKASKQALVDTAVSAAIGGIAGKVVDVAGNAIQNTMNKVAPGIFSNMFGMNKAKHAKDINAALKNAGQTPKQYFEELVGTKVNGVGLIEAGDTLDDIAPKAAQALQDLDLQKHAELAKIDINLSPDQVFNMVDNVKSNLLTKLDKTDNATLKGYIQNAIDEVDNTFTNMVNRKLQIAQVTKEAPTINVADLYAKKSELATRAFKDNGLNDITKNALKEVSAGLNDGIDNLITISGKSSGEAFKKLRLQEQRLKLFNDAVQDTVSSKINPGYSALSEVTKGAAIYGAGKATGLDDQQAAGLATALRLGSKIPGMDTRLGIMSQKIANHIQSMGKNGNVLASSLIKAANQGTDYFKSAIESTFGGIQLQENPIARTAMDVINKQTSIMAVLEHNAPDLAGILKTAIDNNDENTISSVMEKAAKQPGMDRYFESGQGFNGKVTDPADKAEMIKTIELAPISHVQRLQLKKNLINNNIIPKVTVDQPQQDKVEQFQQHKAKKLPNY